MTTISSSTTLAITLTSPTYHNPVVILSGVEIVPGDGSPAVFGSGTSSYWAIQNSGTVSATFGSYGILLDGRGSIDNSTAASISGYGYGIKIDRGPGTVMNDGLVSGAPGIGGRGIRLASGGFVANGTNASIVGGSGGVYISGAVGTVVNHGTIKSGTVSGYGIRLAAGGSVTNFASGSISGTDGGIAVSSHYSGQPGSVAEGTVLNYGSIVGMINMYAGGSVTNAASGVISGGPFGIKMEYPYPNPSSPFRGVVVNDGTILANGFGGAGVLLAYDGLVNNASTNSLIEGFSGVSLQTGTNTVFNDGNIIGTAAYAGDPAILLTGVENTLQNAGGIIGDSGTAIVFYNIDSTGHNILTGRNVLVVDPGEMIDGVVVGNASASNIIELSSATSAGSLSGLGTQFTNFGSISFDAGAKWFIAGNTSGLAGTISGFAYGDTIQVSGITVTESDYAGGVLTLAEASGHVTLSLPGDFITSDFVIENVGAGADVMLSVPCFLAGTRIAMAHGDVPVEELAVDNLVRNQDNNLVPIKWVGYRRIDCRRHPTPRDVWPVRVRGDSFGTGMPHRDLWLSPDHAVFVGDVLIPIKHLTNGTSIEQVPMDEVAYYHIELPQHDVLLAEGLPVESYLDTGDRFNFENGSGPLALHPDFSARRWNTVRIWEALGYARLIVTGPELDSARQLVNSRATAVAHAASAA
jgi:hypothetical protein